MISTIIPTNAHRVSLEAEPKPVNKVNDLAITILSCVKCYRVSEKPLRLLCGHTLCTPCYAKIEKEPPEQVQKCPKPNCTEILCDAEENEVLTNLASSVFKIQKILAEIGLIKFPPLRTEEILLILLRNISTEQWKEGVWFFGERNMTETRLLDIKIALLRTRFSFLPGVFLVVASTKQGRNFLIRFFPYKLESKQYLPTPLPYVEFSPLGHPTIYTATIGAENF